MKNEKSCGAIIIDGDNKVLLIKQKSTGSFGFPKGHVENNETEEQTAIREVKEETGIDIKITSKKRYETSYIHSDIINKQVIYFLAFPLSKNNEQMQEEEIIDLQWIDIEEVTDLLTYEDIKQLWLTAKADYQEI